VIKQQKIITCNSQNVSYNYKPQQSCIHSYPNLVSIILIHNNKLEMKIFFNEEILNKHVDGNIQIPY
jgi:hypothetical protein